MEQVVIGLISAAGGGLIGWMLQTHSRTTSLALANAEAVRGKYEELLRQMGALGNYFEPYAADEGNEYVEHADFADFAPLQAVSSFVDAAEPLTVWVGEETIKAVDKVIEMASHCLTPALHFADGNSPEEERDPQIRALSEHVLAAIESAKAAIRQDLGIDRTVALLRQR